MTEEEMITMICAGGKAMDAGVKVLYQTMAQPMLQFFVYRGASSDEAKDVLQETLIKIVRSAGDYGGSGTPKSWMWQIARNCLIDCQRRRVNQQPTQHERHQAENAENVAAEIRTKTISTIRGGIKVTEYPYAGDDYRPERRTLVTAVGEEEWIQIAETTPAEDPDSSINARYVEDCVANGLSTFGDKEPERAYVLMLQMDGSSIEEIGHQIGRTVAATKEYLSQCKKKIQPFIAHCTELLAG